MSGVVMLMIVCSARRCEENRKKKNEVKQKRQKNQPAKLWVEKIDEISGKIIDREYSGPEKVGCPRKNMAQIRDSFFQNFIS
jgi:hypothetical protein